MDRFEYTFDNLATEMEEFLLRKLALKKFSIYVQDYGAPIGYRITSANPDVIGKIVVQNGTAYVEGIGPAFESMTLSVGIGDPDHLITPEQRLNLAMAQQ